MAAKLDVAIACLVVLFSTSVLSHSSKPLTCGDYRVLGHQSVFQLDNFSKWPCQIFFNVNDKCRPRLLCSKFVLDKKKKSGICDFVVNQLSPDGNNGIQKKVCNALFFQGNTLTLCITFKGQYQYLQYVQAVFGFVSFRIISFHSSNILRHSVLNRDTRANMHFNQHIVLICIRFIAYFTQKMTLFPF